MRLASTDVSMCLNLHLLDVPAQYCSQTLQTRTQATSCLPLQNLRDAIMVTTAGAETLPFLAAFVVLPASLTFFVAYGRMVEHLPHNLVFYASIAPLVRPARKVRQKLYTVDVDQASGF